MGIIPKHVATYSFCLGCVTYVTLIKWPGGYAASEGIWRGKGNKMARSILVVDDDEAMLDVYTRLFSGTDYLITKVSGFAEAARLINSNNYDLLITDLMLGDGLGTELIKIFEKKQAGAKSLLVSGSIGMLAPEQTLDVYFEKPFKAEVFMAAVKKALA